MTIQYKYKKVSDSNYSTLANLSDNTQTTVTLDNQYQWDLVVVIADKIGQTTYNLFVDRGMPIIYYDRKKSSVSVNCFPTKEESFEIEGSLLLNGIDIALNKKILWTNPNPTSSFVNQTITLNNSDYDFYEIIHAPTTGTINKYVEVVKAMKGKGTFLKYFTSKGQVYRRTVEYVSDTELTIGQPTYVDGTLSNENIIPLYVIGYKTGLF